MQIQQQLMMQNQALNQMLSQTKPGSPEKTSLSPRPDQSPTRPQGSGKSPEKPVPVYFGMTEAHRRASESQLTDGYSMIESSKSLSKTAPNTPKHSTALPPQAPTLGSLLDADGRAKTVRIGKWRWPPPKEDGDALAEGFFEFKMRKMKQKEGFLDQSDPKNESLETSEEIQRLDWDDNEEFNKGLKRSQSKDSFTIMEDSNEGPREILESPVANNGTVGKLKISSEMKEKLEAAMGSRKSSVRETGKERGSLEGLDDSVKKLNENRKMILQQKLGGGGKLKKWENIDQELHYKSAEENNSRHARLSLSLYSLLIVISRKSSHDSKSGNIPIPPPPPIAPSFTKPLHVNTDNHHDSTSLASSYYSPGL